MNKRCYRVIFNTTRGLLMTVAEIVPSHGKSGGKPARRKVASASKQGGASGALVFGVWVALGLFSVPAATVQAQMVADPSAPGNQRPTVLAAANGVPVANIQTPSKAGVSRNTYKQFDVEAKGAILNNSRSNTQSQLGGWVQGNPWLATGSAKVILNEVNSNSPSRLGGYVEVAGQRAEVVIANPAGINVDGGGFINASRATLTTGTPLITDGNLNGYQVRSGQISINGAGLDGCVTDYTDLIARSVQVNAGVWANQLKVTAGANQVDAGNATATPIAGTGAAPAVAIDTAQIGGMYAGKITLVGTEAGVGVRNAGNIGASAGELVVTAEGRLENSGRITSAGTLQLDSTKGIANSGTLYSQTDASLTTRGHIDNSGTIAAQGNASLAATGADSVVTSTSVSALGAGVQADGSLGDSGALSVQATQQVVAQGKNLAGGDLTLGARSLKLAGSTTSAKNLNLSAAVGDLDLSSASVAVSRSLTASAGQTLRTDSARISAAQLTLSAYDLSNVLGEIVQIGSGDFSLIASSALTNRGLIDGRNTWLAAATLNNLGTGRIYGDHVAIAAATLNNNVENGVAPVIAARERLDIGATTINNREHALLFSVGDLAIGGGFDVNHWATGQAGTLNNASATMESLGNMALNVGQINNTNEHFSTRVDSLPEKTIHDYVGGGPAYVANPPEVAVIFVGGAGRRYLHTPDGDFYSYYQRDYIRTTSETRVTESDPAQILAGGSITFTTGNLLNDKSRIIAGGALSGSFGSLTNTEVAGERVITDNGRIGYFSPHKDHTNTPDNGENGGWQSYSPAPVTETFNLVPKVFKENTTPTGTGTQINAHSTVNGINTQVPNNSLFAVRPGPTSRYLVETDPRFTNFRQWLSSDYLLRAMQSDPATTQKRLGDGFYEQKLVREQIAQLTGRRFLEGYADDEAQYLALMNNAATFAQAANLRPGVALSAAQMAQLTSDIVWLVAQSVTLADGSTTQVLAPQVYVRVQDGDLQASGALIAGDSINLRLSGDLSNSGTIAGRKAVALTAENVQNLGGRIQGNEVAVQARTDLNNLGGTITATGSLSAIAGRDLKVTTTTRSSATAQSSRTNIDRVAGLYLTGGSGNLIAAAGRDLTLTGAVVANQGTGAIVLSADRNLNLDTVRESFQQAIVWDSSNFRKEASHTDIGTAVRTVGDLRLNAGNDLNLKAANVTSDLGELLVTAGNNINLTTGEAFSFYDQAHRSKSKGFLSSTTTATRDTLNQTQALGTTLSGETATVFAGRDLNVRGGNIVSTEGTTLNAGQDINLLAAINTSQESHFRSEKKSGLLSSGGVGFTIGSQQQSTDQQGGRTTASASTVGSTEGDVRIQAGRNYTQVGSNVVAPVGDIDINAQRVSIMEARETSKASTETKTKQSGVTIGVTNPVLSAVQTGQQMWSAAQDTKDTRMRALAAASTGLAANNALDAVKTGQGTTINGKENQVPTKLGDDGKPIEGRDATTAERMGGVNVSVSFGTSSSRSKTTQTSDSAAGSTVAVGGDVRIRAAGAGAGSDLTVQGSTITGGRNVNLLADDEIQLLTAQNRADQHSTNKNSSGSIGISYGSDGLLLNAGASGGKGKADGTDVAYTNTQVEAGDRLTLQSGGDTTLRGAVATGRRVTADVGGDLNIESLQDTSTYASKQQSLGGSVSVGSGRMSGSVSASKSTINSNFQSVGEQSGIKAGDEGFDVNVEGNTDLKGAVIASTDQAVAEGKNRFATGSLSMSDIENKAEYDAKGVGVNFGSGWGPGGKLTPQGTSAGVGQGSGSAESTTKSGISGIAGNKEVRTGDAETGIKPIFDAEKVQKEINAQVAITQQFGQLASKAVGDYAKTQTDAAKALRTEANRLSNDDPRRAELEQQAKALDDQWGGNGTLRLAAHTLVGGLTGGASGAAGAAVGTFTAAQVGDQLAKAGISGPLADTLTGLASTAAGAAAGGTAGAATALNEVANNYLNHADAEKLNNLKAKRDKGECGADCQNEITRLERQDAELERKFIAASIKCRETTDCKDLRKFDTQMTKDMGWIGLLSKGYESKGDPGASNLYLDPKTGELVLRVIKKTGKIDKGGPSYGSYQIATYVGTMDDFMGYLKKNDRDSYDSLYAAGGVEAAKNGSIKFLNTWQSLAMNGTNFSQLQHQFIDEKKYQSSYRYATQYIPDLESRSPVLLDVIWSGAVQHDKKNVDVIKAAWRNKSNASDEELIRAYFEVRKSSFSAEAKRYNEELQTALQWLNNSKKSK